MDISQTISIQDVAKKQIETTKKVYLLSPERMFSEYNGEKENVKNYNGRQLLEMLQNADDAASEAKSEKKVLIKLLDNTLIIANTGYYFSEEGLKSIFHSHLSPKEAKENQIGNKGLGFRSILSWAEKVTIKSHDLCISFSTEFSKKVLDELLQDESFKNEFQKLNKGHQTPISTLVCPDTEPSEVLNFHEIESYDTIIQIDLLDSAIPEIKIQVQNDLDGEVLLFLNNLQKIEIDINGELSGFNKKHLTSEKIEIESYKDKILLKKVWNINSILNRFEDIDRHYQLSLAWQDNLEENKNVIYAYFRTKVPIKCMGILHGSFDLNADRNLIIDDSEGYNKKLLSLLPEFIAQTAEKIAQNERQEVNYKPIRFLNISIDSLSHLVNLIEFNDKLESLIKTKKIFPAISNQYFTWNESKPFYYEEEEFAKYLNPEKFNLLLHFCNDEVAETLIKSLEPCTYKIEGIIKDISIKKDEISTEEYAKLIFVIHKYIDEKTELGNCALFYDKAKNLLNFYEPIFLPKTVIKYILPPNLGVQIIDSELADKLVEVFSCENYSALCSKLHKFNIKEYKFSELVESLISYYNSTSAKVENLIELNSHIFNIYSNEENPGIKWEGSAVSLINKNGDKKLANELYFGKEYGNPLTEELYSFDKSKILASNRKLKAENINENEWKKYLTWLGVEIFPRKVILNKISMDYFNYCLQNYNYKNTIGDYRFNNYSELRKHFFYFGESRIQSIDSLENILIKDSFEVIIRWIEADNDLLGKIIEDREPKDSKIEIKFNSDHNFRYLQGINIKSYIKWLFQTKPWIETESSVRQAPNLCTTASNVNADFSPHIEKPLINYDRFLRLGINRDKLEHFITVVGVHKSMTTFSTKTLDSILLKLPGMEEGRKKAKTIYNQLAVNYDNKLLDRIDKTDNSYLEFRAKGQVFCQNGVLAPVNDVYYVNDKRYGESVLKHFNTIEIDRRRGKEIIKKLFGVEPLDKIDLNLDSDPKLHFANSDFENEIRSFKPYVYILRKDADGGSEKNLIKDVIFKLVTDIKLRLLKDGQYQILDLNDYESFYLKKRNTVFIKAPTNLNIENLKKDIDFCSAVAEAFSAILDVDSQRQQLIHLFSINDSDRDTLLRNEIDGNYSQKLSESRLILGYTSNPKLEFWKSFSRCFKGKKINLISVSDNDLLEELTTKFPKHEEVIAAVLDQINYSEINEELSSDLIVRLFKNVGITINQFNQFHYPKIDINELYEISFKRTLDNKRNAFKSLYYEMCLINNDLKNGFCDILNEYCYLKPNVINEVDFDNEKDLTDQIKKEYNIDISNEVQQLNIDELFQKNLELAWQIIDDTNTDRKLFDQFINEKSSTRSLIYFEDQLIIIKDQFNAWVGEIPEDNKRDNSKTKSKRIAFGNHTILYNDLADLKNQIDSFLEIEGLNKITSSIIKTITTETNSDDKDDNKTKGGNKGSKKPKTPKEDVGFIGEYIVYRYLLETLNDIKSVKWVSSYARDCGINLDGKDGLGYDMEYIPNGGVNPRYVEVKVVGWEDAFHISSKEVKYGEKYKKNHEIFLVRNLDTPINAKIERIQGLFDYKGKSFTNNDLFSVINDNYIIKFKKAE
jgi:hypothetical protein